MENFTEEEIHLIVSCLNYKWYRFHDLLKEDDLGQSEILQIIESKQEIKDLIHKIES